jgi:hypothetical protein
MKHFYIAVDKNIRTLKTYSKVKKHSVWALNFIYKSLTGCKIVVIRFAISV